MKTGAWAPIAAAALALAGPGAYAQSSSVGATGSFGSAGGVSGAGFTAARPNVTANLTPGRAFRIDGRFHSFTPQGLVPTGGIGNAQQQNVLLPGGGFPTRSLNEGTAADLQGMNRSVAGQMMMRSQLPAAMVPAPRFVPRMVGPRTFAPADLTPNRSGFAAVPGRAFRINGQFFSVTPQGLVPTGGIGNAQQQNVLLPGGRLPAGFGTPAAVTPVVAPITTQAVTPITRQAVTPITAQAVTPIFTSPGVTPVINPVVAPVTTPVVFPTVPTTNAITTNGFTNATLAQNQALAANTATRFNSAAQAQAAVQATRGVNPFTLGANATGRVNPFTVLPGDPAAARGLDPFAVGFFNDPFRTPPVNTVFDPFNVGRVPPTAVGPNTNVQVFPGFGSGSVGFWGPFGWSPIGFNNLTGFINPYGYGVGYAPGYYPAPAVAATPAPFFRTTAAARRRGTASPVRWIASADPEQQALKHSMETLSRTRPLKMAEVTDVGDTQVEVMYVDESGQGMVARVPLEEIFFFDANQRLQSGATARDLVRVGARVLVPVPETGTVEESVAGSREESRVRVKFRQQ